MASASTAASPCLSGRVVLSVSNAMSENQKAAREQWVRRARLHLLTARDTYGEAMRAFNNNGGEDGVGSGGLVNGFEQLQLQLQQRPTLAYSDAQLEGLKKYYDTALTPPHIAVDLYGLDCPVSSALFASAVVAASSSSATNNSTPSASFLSDFLVSAVVPDHIAVLEHKSLVAPSAASSQQQQGTSPSSSSSLMRAIGATLADTLGNALLGSSDPRQTVSPHFIASLRPLMAEETQRLANLGAVKPNLCGGGGGGSGSAAAFVTNPNAKRFAGCNKAGLVYLVRSNKSVAVMQQGAAGGGGAADEEDLPIKILGAAAFTVVITLSDRNSIGDLLHGYVTAGNAYLVGEVALHAPSALQPLPVAGSSALVLPSVGALWLSSGVSLAVPTTMRASTGNTDTHSRVFAPLTNDGRRDADVVPVNDTWDLIGHRPNRLLKVKSAVVAAHPLTTSTTAATAAAGQQQQASHPLHKLTVALAWQLLLSTVVKYQTRVLSGAAFVTVLRGILSPALFDLVSGSENGRLPPQLLDTLAEGVRKGLVETRRRTNQSSNSTDGSATHESATIDAELAEMFLLSSDDEASLQAEGLVSAGGDGTSSSATGGVSAAKILALQVLESTTRSSHALLAAANGGAAAPIAPSEKILFVAKLNPRTTAGGLATCFQQFGEVVSCEIPQDKKTGRSRCYAFVEFDTVEACNSAYAKMGGVMIDDCAIHVDFCQSTVKEELEMLQKQRARAREDRAAARAARTAEKRPREEGVAAGAQVVSSVSAAIGGGSLLSAPVGVAGATPAAVVNAHPMAAPAAGSLLPLPPPQ